MIISLPWHLSVSRICGYVDFYAVSGEGEMCRQSVQWQVNQCDYMHVEKFKWSIITGVLREIFSLDIHWKHFTWPKLNTFYFTNQVTNGDVPLCSNPYLSNYFTSHLNNKRQAADFWFSEVRSDTHVAVNHVEDVKLPPTAICSVINWRALNLMRLKALINAECPSVSSLSLVWALLGLCRLLSARVDWEGSIITGLGKAVMIPNGKHFIFEVLLLCTVYESHNGNVNVFLFFY